jgi:hypothetical protein
MSSLLPHILGRALTVVIFLVISGLAESQEFTPVADPVVTGRVDEPPPSPLVAPRDPMVGKTRSQGFDLGVIISGAYNDNIFLSASDAKSDFVSKVTPTIGYSRGDRDSQEGGYLKVAYRPSGVVYARSSSENRIDHEATAAIGLVGNKVAVDYSVAYGKIGDATPDTGRQADRQLFEHVVRIAWVPREKLALEVAAGQSIAEYADKVLLDSREAFGEVALRYAYSPKTRLGLAYRGGRFEVEDMQDQRFQRLTGKIEWQPREKIRVELEAGAEKRKYVNGSSVTPVVEGRIDWSPSEKTNYFLTAYRRETASAFSAGQNYRLTGATAGVSQKIGEKWTAHLEGGFENASYRQVEGIGGDVGKDTLWFVRPAISYRFTEELGLEIFYRVSSNDSSRAGFGYDQQSAGILLEYKF